MKSVLRTLLVVALAVGAIGGPAQAGAVNPIPAVPKAIAGDAEWEMLQSLLAPNGAGRGRITDWLSAADKFQAFAQSFPGHSRAADAQCLEAIMLARAAFAGDTAHEVRRNATAAGRLHDKAVTPALRAELMATSATVTILRGSYATRELRLAAFEQSSRNLVAEFPDLELGYESLLGIAHDSTEAHAAALARELTAMPRAPDWVKAKAQVIADRMGLVGRPVIEVLGSTGAADSPLAGGAGKVVIYSWSKASAPSMLAAKAVAKPGIAAVLLGICVDTDGGDPNAVATSAGLPGAQINDPTGEIAKKLKLTEPGLMYGVDAKGVIQSVALQNDLAAAFLAGS